MAEENNARTWNERRKNFMETYQNDPILSKKLPEVAAGLMKAEMYVVSSLSI